MEKEFWQVYKDKGVVVIGISIWAEGDPFEIAKEFVKECKITYPVLVAPETDHPVVEAYKVLGVPTNVVIDKEGKIRYLQAGFDPEGIKQAIEEALK